MKLVGKTNKGKQRIKSFGNSWEIIRKSQTVIFSGKSGEWWLIKPEGFSDDCTESRWMHSTDDNDFIICK